MRTITIVMDDNGSTEVKVLPDPESGRFFTKRDFDNALRATKKAYRRSIKEFRKNQRKNVKEQKDDIGLKKNGGEIEDGKERGKEPGADNSRTKEQAFAGAVNQALKRSGKLNFRKGSSEAG